MASFPSHDTAMGGGTMSERRHRKAEHTEEWEQTSPLSARHIAGVMLAEKSGVECARGRYLWDFTLVISPISRHPKSAYASQGLWRGLLRTCELLRTPSLRSSQNFPSMHFGE